MTNIAPSILSPDPALVKQAIAWMVSLQSNQHDANTLASCVAWRQTSPEHELAWQRTSIMHSALQKNLHGMPDGVQSSKVLQSTIERMQKRRSFKLLTLAAMLSGTALITRSVPPLEEWLSDYETSTGERRNIRLSDGSELMLNTDSSVTIHFNEHERLIVLSRGEIMITSGADIHSPEKRPLRVRTRHTLLEAIGTQFVVRLQQDATLLSMQQGLVAMTPASLNQSQHIAESGQHYLIYQDHLNLVDLPMEADSWTQGVLVVKEIRLADFITELARYRHGYLKCDPAVADLRLSGVFQLEDTNKILTLLPHQLPVAITYRTRWWITVSAQS